MSANKVANNYTSYVNHSNSAEAAGAAISGGYNGNSFAILALIPFFSGLAMYNVVELMVLIFFTFNKFRGLYFWSLIVAGLGIIPYSLGFLFKFLIITPGKLRWFAVTLITIGWWTMVTGQSVVLWSRLHLLVSGGNGERTLRWTKWMIIVDAIILHIPTTVLTYGSNGDVYLHTFTTAYSVMEKIQMCGFFIQEVILSTIYIVQTAKIIRTSIREDSRRFMIQLLGINIIIIIMDLALLGLEAASLYLLETLLKGVIYSIKLKLEFAILGKLVQFVGGRPGTSTAEERWRKTSTNFAVPAIGGSSDEEKSRRSSHQVDIGTAKASGIPHHGPGQSDISEFVDLSRIRTNVSYADCNSAERIDSNRSTYGSAQGVGGHRRKTHTGRRGTLKSRPGVTDEDIDIARFLHDDNASLPDDDEDYRDKSRMDATEENIDHSISPMGRTGEGEV